MKNFASYAGYYDLVNRGKDYSAECDFILGRLQAAGCKPQSLLELGCGTGGHALEFSRRGCVVHGIDMSADMIGLARGRASASDPAGPRPHFEMGDARDFRANARFDAVLSLFHVVSYQTSNADLMATFATAREHLVAGGYFFFDFWYGPAVLSDRPRHVEKVVSDDKLEVERRTTPTMHVNDNVVNIRFDIRVRSLSDGGENRFSEDHRMRYLFLPELQHMLGVAGFELQSSSAWLSAHPPSDSSWYACCTARAV